MNSNLKITIEYIVLSIILGMLSSSIIGIFLPKVYLDIQIDQPNTKELKIDIKQAFLLKDRIVQKVVKKEKKRKKVFGRSLLLKEFSISGIFISNDSKGVLIRSQKGRVVLNIGEMYKGYKLKEVYIKKARFVKNDDSYWAFLDPLDEKEFKNSKTIKPSQIKKKSSIYSPRKTIAQEMFEDIKYKNGKYYIPKSILSKYNNLGSIFDKISIQVYNLNGKISFRVRYVSKYSVFYKLGIRKGDFILKVNGKGFKNVNEPLKYFQNLKELKQLSITIKRGRKIKELKYEIY